MSVPQRQVTGSPARIARVLLALALLACTLPAAPALAQESPPRDGRRQERDRNDDDRNDDEDDEDERALPFDTDRLFVPRWRLTDGPHVHAAFRPVVSQVRTATVQVFCDGKRRGLGGVVGADGWILTKATPLCDEVTCELADGRRLVGRTVSTNRQYDLALVKVQASGLPALSLADEVPIEVGAWLATVGTTRDPIAVGVVSVPAREIPAQPGRLGIIMSETDAPVVADVVEEGGAAAAGVKANDRIVSVEGRPTRTGTELRRTISSYNPGDTVALEIERGDERLTLRATLQGSIPGFEGRSEFQNSLGGQLSVRRFGFPLAVQHDTALRPVDCGGPVVDLDGRVVGFNIARAGRTESFLIPTGAARQAIAELMAAGQTAAAAAAEAPAAGDSPRREPTSLQGPQAAAETAAAEPGAVQSSRGPSVPAAKAAAAYADEGYKLVWFDEFDADGRPDPAKWTYERGFVRNEELQWYRPDNARCTGGVLVIEGRKERIPNPRYQQGSRQWQRNREYAEYTSSSLLTRGIADWQYGRFEMRGRIDVRQGLWPAWWTLGHGDWPACGEIDIMEYYRGMLLANFAWAGERRRGTPTWDDSRLPLEELGGEAWARDFHEWRMDWDEQRIVLSVDGRVLNEVDLDSTVNAGDERENPLRAPHYMILNLAIGGLNGGELGETEFPAKFEVDYVRVYQK